MDSFIRKQGCRLVDEEDWRWLDGDTTHFTCPWIKGVERGSLGDRPIVLIGGGPSCGEGIVKGAYRIAINPRFFTPKAEAMLSIDSVYWTHGRFGKDGLKWAQEWPYHHEATFFFGPSGPTPIYTQHPAQHRFGHPMFPIKSKHANDEITIRVGDGVKSVNIAGIAGLLVARYLSTGPIILIGFDLKGKHIRGETFDYERRQLWKWKTVEPLMEDVFIHENNPGPLRQVFKEWRGK